MRHFFYGHIKNDDVHPAKIKSDKMSFSLRTCALLQLKRKMKPFLTHFHYSLDQTIHSNLSNDFMAVIFKRVLASSASFLWQRNIGLFFAPCKHAQKIPHCACTQWSDLHFFAIFKSLIGSFWSIFEFIYDTKMNFSNHCASDEWNKKGPHHDANKLVRDHLMTMHCLL